MSKKFVYKQGSIPWPGLCLGGLAIVCALLALLGEADGVVWRGVYIPVWPNWIILVAGICIIAYSIYDFILRKGKPETYTDEEVAQAEAEMDAMYLKKYGELPDKPKPEIVVGETVEPEKPQKNTE